MNSDLAKHWREQAAKESRLTDAEELHLGRIVQVWQTHPDGPDAAPIAVQRRGLRARNRMVSANLLLVHSVAAKMFKHLGVHVKDSDFPDVLQEGAMGLMRGCAKFDPERGYKLSTYVYWWIRQGISRWRDSKSRLVRLPGQNTKKMAQILARRESLGLKLWRGPSAAELAADMGIPEDDVLRLMLVGQQPTSLSAPCHHGDGETVLMDVIAAPTPAEDPQLDELRERMALLRPETQDLLGAYYGIGTGKASQTQAQIAQAMGLTRQGISSRLAVAHRRLRGLVA